MLHEILAPRNRANRDGIWPVALGALAAVQLVAFWMLCSHQVRLAESREAGSQMQQMAMSDCLRYIPNATIASCSNRLGGSDAHGDAPLTLAADNRSHIVLDPGQRSALRSATPVNYSLR